MDQVDRPEEELSIWPAVMGLAVAMIGLGIVTNIGFSLLGVLLVAFGIWGWIGELIGE
ncbi:MAG: hypothetical protein R3A46_21345 [Thermomicrobiales bacterium]